MGSRQKLTWRKIPEIEGEGSLCGHGQRHLVSETKEQKDREKEDDLHT